MGRPSGKFVTIRKNVKSFVPAMLPPTFGIENLLMLATEASRQIGLLDGPGRRLKNPHILIKPQLMKEAVQSSRIGGSQVSLSDLYKFQIGNPKKEDDSEEVNNYVDALETALQKVSKGGDINLDLMNDCHRMLLRNVRGNDTAVGALNAAKLDR